MYQATTAGGFGHGRIGAGRAVLCVGWGVAAGASLWLATRPALPAWVRRGWERLPAFARWPVWRAALTVYLLWVPIYGLTAQLPDALRGHYHNDAIAYIHADADLWRQGINPFTDDQAFWDAAARWPLAFATPLLGSPIFGNDPLNYPSSQAQGVALRGQLADPAQRNHDFDPRTVHNYPGGIIWLALPLVWSGVPSVIWLNLLALLALGWLLVAHAPARMRWVTLFVFAASPVIWLYTLLENYDVVCIVFIIAAWQWLPRAWLSPILLGIACAVKQLAWFFVPFHLLAIARRAGWRAAALRAGWLALGFVALNLPFILISPVAWLHGILVPQTDALFPIGYGLVALGLGGVVPIGTARAWTALEVLVLLALLLWQWLPLAPAFIRDKMPLLAHPRVADPRGAESPRSQNEPLRAGNLFRLDSMLDDGEVAGILLALVPLWFAWRSPMNYFAFLPVLALWVVNNRAAMPSGLPD